MNYDISDLDDSGQVKPGFFLLLVMVFLSRQFLYGPLALLASRKGRGGSGATGVVALRGARTSLSAVNNVR